MKETQRRRRTVTSSFNKISTYQLEGRVVVRGGCVTPRGPNLFEQQLLDRYLKTTWTIFPHSRFFFASCPSLPILRPYNSSIPLPLQFYGSNLAEQLEKRGLLVAEFLLLNLQPEIQNCSALP
jgi:hypothetical protein